ncbi:nuclear transport factor 2 family protein [Mucilaginibacter sp. L196]|uniref:nuclear transport factor 2 family protein n=1 Tax=Mucilaginibacter sp. L196 TaxID=1641870 RepID=UPI00131C46F4|nr:nuclear transport factor 2 family protein [Mucilaginibacter sp. L196]
MKTLKLMLAGIALLFTSVAANAAVKSAKNGPTQSDVVNMYINAIKTGTTTDLTKILNSDMQFNLKRGENVNTLNKAQLLDYLKNNTVANPDVTTTTTILTDDGNAARVKVEFKYDGYTRVDEITLTKSSGWGIANVDSTFS